MDFSMHDVAIVGYGPVGATLAGLLGNLGVNVVVFEKNLEIYPMPRAVGFDHDAMRIFQCVGITDQIKDFIEPFRDEIYLGADGRLLQHFKHMPKPYPLTWDPHFTCDQPKIEKALRQKNAGMPNLEVRLGAEFQTYQQKPNAVSFQIKSAKGETEFIEAKYLIACDGASSSIRSQMNIDLESMNYDESWLVVDMKVKEAVLDRLPRTNVQYCDPVRPSTMICCPGNHRRWEFMKLPTDAPETLIQEEQLWKLMSPWISPGDAEIWRAAAYRFHALVANNWQDRRVFLAGDSAHQTPPFIGQGMCQGIRDAGNLAWKLHQVIRGSAHENLLTTYTQERRPNVVATTQLAKDCGLMISERDQAKARVRDEEISTETNGLGRLIIRQDLIPALDAGLIVTSEPLSGKVFPQPVVMSAGQGDVMMDELVQTQFHLVVLADHIGKNDLNQLCTEAAHAGILTVVVSQELPLQQGINDQVLYVKEIAPLIQNFVTSHSCMGVIVRPDHYVYCGLVDAKSAQFELSRLVSKLSV